MRRQLSARMLLGVIISYNLFACHWARDSLGALELPLEAADGGYRLSSRQFNSLTTLYFLPNCFVPMIAGTLAQRGNPARVYIGFTGILFAGCVLVAASALAAAAGGGGSAVAYAMLLMGRLLMGISYEALDMLGPITFLQPRFADVWATCVSVVNGVNRLGSILNFLVEPLLFSSFGLSGALLVPSVLGASTLAGAVAARSVHERHPLPPARGAAGDVATARDAQEEQEQEREDEEVAVDAAGKGVRRPTLADRLTLLFGITPRHVRSLGLRFWLFLLGAACTYGAIVPFWFIGAKHIAVAWGYTLAEADQLILFPEGLIALIGPPMGCFVDRCGWSARTRLLVSTASLTLMGASLLVLGYAPVDSVSPLPLVIVLGASYAVAQNLIWMTFPSLAPADMLNLVGGLLGSSLNVAPTLLPVLVLSGDDLARDVRCLGVTGLVGAVLYAVAAALALPASKVRARASGDAAAAAASMESAHDEGGEMAAARPAGSERCDPERRPRPKFKCAELRDALRDAKRNRCADRESKQKLVAADSCAELRAAADDDSSCMAAAAVP